MIMSFIVHYSFKHLLCLNDRFQIGSVKRLSSKSSRQEGVNAELMEIKFLSLSWVEN